MSVSRTTVRLIAICMASGALVGAAAMPALADQGGHDRDSGRSYSYRHTSDAVRGDRDHDRDRDRFGDRDRDRRHGWYGDQHRHHDH
ncbi:hypothetical protein [Streptomyces mirabilis]|uniref:hypothetical protein n=1 Tax=Streptomyces mirabilis TaxID=68239 RepID=UPI0036BE1BE7